MEICNFPDVVDLEWVS